MTLLLVSCIVPLVSSSIIRSCWRCEINYSPCLHLEHCWNKERQRGGKKISELETWQNNFESHTLLTWNKSEQISSLTLDLTCLLCLTCSLESVKNMTKDVYMCDLIKHPNVALLLSESEYIFSISFVLGKSDFQLWLTMWLHPPFFSMQILHLGH